MLPKTSRISRENFSELLKSSKFYHSPHFILRVGNAALGRARFGVSVSKKISKKAVTRNLIRRRVYSILNKKIINLFPTTALFVAKIGAEKIRGVELEKEIEKILRSSNLIKE